MRGLVGISGDSSESENPSRFRVAVVEQAMRLPNCDVERTSGREPMTSREITDLRRELRLREGTPGSFRRQQGEMLYGANTARVAPSGSRR